MRLAITRPRYWATWKLREVLNDHYCRGIDGKDFEPQRDELASELYRRDARIAVELWKNDDKLDKQRTQWEQQEKANLRARIETLRLCPPENPQAFLDLLERLRYDIEHLTKESTCPFLWECVMIELQQDKSA